MRTERQAIQQDRDDEHFTFRVHDSLGFRFFRYLNHHFAAGVMRRGLFIGFRRFIQRKYLRNNRLDFFLLDELRDFVQICRVWR